MKLSFNFLLLIFVGVVFLYKDLNCQNEYFIARKGINTPINSIYHDGKIVSIYNKNTTPYDTLFFDIFNTDGVKTYSKKVPNFNVSKINKIVNTKDNNFLLWINERTHYDNVIIKLDSLGNLIWFKLISENLDYSTGLLSDKNRNSYIITTSIDSASGLKSQNPYGSFDIWIIKIDKFGNKVWDKIYGGVGREQIYDCKTRVNNDNIVMVGCSASGVSGNKTSNKIYQHIGFEAWALEIDTNGNIIKDRILFAQNGSDAHFKSLQINSQNEIIANYSIYGGGSPSNMLAKLDVNYNIVWAKTIESVNNLIFFANNNEGGLYAIDDGFGTFKIRKHNSLGDLIWSQDIQRDSNVYHFLKSIHFDNNKFIFQTFILLKSFQGKSLADSFNWIFSTPAKSKITGKVFPDFNLNCKLDSQIEINFKNITIHNKAENTYAITNDSIYTMYLIDSDTAVLKIINLDSNLYVACGKDSIVVDMTGKKDTSGIDFPIRSNKKGHCINITSFSSGLLRPGRWGDYQLNYQNHAFDTAYNAYIVIEVDTAAIDSITSPYSFTLTGNVLRFNLGHVRPFGFSSVAYSIKLKTTVIIGSSHCHRAKVYPICNLYPSAVYDSSEIQPMMRCLPNDTVEFTLKNIGLRDQKDWGHSIIYMDDLMMKKDSFKLTVGNSRIFKYKLDTNKVFTAEVFNSNFHPVTPILIRHNDLCANRRPMIPQNAALNFSRHDEAKEYEEACTIVRGSYDPNMKSVLPVGMFSQHYTATGTELKYRLDFQNTGTDTAFRVVLIDTLSADLDIASFVPGASSHPYSIEFGGRAVKFIFDPIALVDSFKNEPLSHGYVCFKIKHKNGIAPKTKIENFVDIYFDYNTPVRTNTVFNTVFDTIQVYIPKIVVLDTFVVTPDSLKIPALANNLGKINIQTNKSWTASSNQSWAALSLNSGTGNKQIAIQASTNLGPKRIAIITILSGSNILKTFKLIQLDSSASFLLVSPDTIFAPASASNNLQFSVNSNTSWNLLSMQPWVSLNSSSGVNNKSITLNIQANSSSSKRIASISATSGTLPSRKLVIVQASKNSSAINNGTSNDADIYPIPVRYKFYLQMSEPVKDLSIEIYDMLGRLTKSISSTNSQTLEVSAEGMTKGIYHIRVMSGEKLVVVKKVMVE